MQQQTSSVKSFRDLIVWQRSIDLVEDVYRAARTFPPEETFRLTSQLTRAVVSIPANIAEGQGRATTKDFLNFLAIARGSLNETETLLVVAHRLGYLNDQALANLLGKLSEVGRILSGLRVGLANRRPLATSH